MNANQMERAAYIAAHKILTTDLNSPELACPGARRSAVVDHIAEIIKDVFEAHSQRFDENTDWWPAASASLEITSLPQPAALRAIARTIGVPGARSLR